MAKEIWKPGTMLYPLPSVMVSCGDYGSKKDFNIITIAWTGTINTNPPMAYISVRPERFSYGIIKKYGCFVINIATEELTQAVDLCGVKSGKDTDKFSLTGLTPRKSAAVTAPSILESPLSIECTVKQIVPLGSHHMFISEVAAVSADDRYMDDQGKFHLESANPICYSHGQYYGLSAPIGKFGYSVKKAKKRNNKNN